MKTPSKSSAAIYRKAAQQIEECADLYCCDAIRHAGYGTSYNSIQLKFFEYLFMPKDQHWTNPWFGPDCVENKESRILALLFVAEIVEMGGL